MNDIFNICMESLYWLSKITGLTYQEVNVILFCFAWPIFTIFLIYKAYFKK